MEQPQEQALPLRCATECPECGAIGRGKVVYSRAAGVNAHPDKDERPQVRRRECSSCNHRWTTAETTLHPRRDRYEPRLSS